MSIGKLWVRIGSGLVTRVSFDNCNDVSDFIKACRVEFSALGVAIGGKTDLYLSNNVNEACLDGLLINDLLLQIGDVGSSSKNPLYLHVKKNPASFTGIIPYEKYSADFRKKSSAVETFPENGFPKKLFDRSEKVQAIFDAVRTPEYASYYFRGPPGTGKALMIYLLGEKLQVTGDSLVYVVPHSGYFENISEDIIEVLLKDSIQLNKKLYLLVDEVQFNHKSPLWSYLLKPTPTNLVVVGFGIRTVNDPSLQFQMSYPLRLFRTNPVEPMYLANSELPPFKNYWMELYPNKQYCIDLVVDYMHNFTGGLHLSLDPTKAFTEMKFHLVSNDFFNSETYFKIRDRSFSVDERVEACVWAYFRGDFTESDIEKLHNYGFWSTLYSRFYSELFLSVMYFKIQGNKFGKSPKIKAKVNLESLIKLGFRDLKESNFAEPVSDLSSYEDKLSYDWSTSLNNYFSNICVCPQYQVSRHSDGIKPTIDYLINSHFQIYFEFVLNGTMSSVLEHLNRFFSPSKNLHSLVLSGKCDKRKSTKQTKARVTKGSYSSLVNADYSNFAIVNIDLSENFKTPCVPTHKFSDKVYTFSKYQNALYRGKVKISDGPLVLSFPCRQFSTSVLKVKSSPLTVLKTIYFSLLK